MLRTVFTSATGTDSSEDELNSGRRFLGLGWNNTGQRGLVVSSPPASKEIGTMGREIESRQGKRW
jgi:hypothetical protein